MFYGTENKYKKIKNIIRNDRKINENLIANK